MEIDYESPGGGKAPTGSAVAPIGVGLGIGAAVTLPALLLACISSGGLFGHGDFVVARALFPIAMASTWITGSVGGTALMLALVQWPVYGFAAGWLIASRRPRWMAAILLLHLAAFVIASATRNF